MVDKNIYIVQGEINAVVGAIKRNARWSTHTHLVSYLELLLPVHAMAETTWFQKSASIFCFSTHYSTFVSKVGVTFYIVSCLAVLASCVPVTVRGTKLEIFYLYPVNKQKIPHCIPHGSHLPQTFITWYVRDFEYMLLFYLAQHFYIFFVPSQRRQSSS